MEAKAIAKLLMASKVGCSWQLLCVESAGGLGGGGWGGGGGLG